MQGSCRAWGHGQWLAEGLSHGGRQSSKSSAAFLPGGSGPLPSFAARTGMGLALRVALLGPPSPAIPGRLFQQGSGRQLVSWDQPSLLVVLAYMSAQRSSAQPTSLRCMTVSLAALTPAL